MIQKTFIKKLLRENLIDKTITCEKCGWHWKKSEAGPDMYFCHKCNHDNTPDNITEENILRKAAGVLIKCTKTDRVFLLLRNDKTPIWSLMSGGIDEGEEPIEALKREMVEELFVRPGNIQFKPIRVEQIPERNMEFHYYQGLTNTEFIPILDHENLDAAWFSKDKLPSPLFRGLAEKIAAI